MAGESERITQIHTSAEVGQYVRQASDIEQIERELVAKHNLRYEMANVQYNYNPLFVARHSSRDFAGLIRVLSERYDLKFIVPRELRAEGRFDDEDIKAVLTNQGFTFADGLLIYTDRGEKIVRVITLVNLHEQNFQVAVVGRTGEAEFVASSVINDFMRWGEPDLAWQQFMVAVDFIRYQTRVRCTFPVPLDTLIESRLSGKLAELAETQVGVKFGYNEKDGNALFGNRSQIIPALHSIEFAISVQNRVSGQSLDGILELSVVNRQHRGMGVITFRSSLPSDDHVRLIYQLIQLYK